MDKSEASKLEFENDIKRLLEISEMITLRLVTTYGDKSIVESIF